MVTNYTAAEPRSRLLAEYTITPEFHALFLEDKSVVIFYTPTTAEEDTIVRVLDTFTAPEQQGLLRSILPTRDLRSFLHDTDATQTYLREFISNHEGTLRALAYAVDSWAGGTDTDTLTNIPLGVTGISQWNERVVTDLVTSLVNTINTYKTTHPTHGGTAGKEGN